MKLSIASIVVICNHVMHSTLWLLIIFWGDSNKMLRNIMGAIRNYLWSGQEQLTHIGLVGVSVA